MDKISLNLTRAQIQLLEVAIQDEILPPLRTNLLYLYGKLAKRGKKTPRTKIKELSSEDREILNQIVDNLAPVHKEFVNILEAIKDTYEKPIPEANLS